MERLAGNKTEVGLKFWQNTKPTPSRAASTSRLLWAVAEKLVTTMDATSSNGSERLVEPVLQVSWPFRQLKKHSGESMVTMWKATELDRLPNASGRLVWNTHKARIAYNQIGFQKGRQTDIDPVPGRLVFKGNDIGPSHVHGQPRGIVFE